MQQLEQRARQLAEESLQEKAAADKKLLFVRSTTTDEDLGELTKTHNPEEIDIDVDSDDDEVVEEMAVHQQPVPSKVFGGLADEAEKGDD